MFSLDALAVGILLIAIGLVFVLLARLLVRAVPLIRPPAGSELAAKPLPVNLPPNPDALLLIQAGGRVIHANQQARDWLDIPEDELPNLEHLARRARPREVFLNLCTSEGHARFSLQGLYVEGSSFPVPGETGPLIALTLRRPQLTALTENESGLPGEALDIISELSQAMTASLDLKITLKAVLDNVDRLVPSDFSEITLWDKAQERLVPYRYISSSGTERQLETTNERYAPGEGFSGYLISRRAPLLIRDVDTFTEVRPAIDRHRYPLKSYLGFPLTIAGEPIGTLELASLVTSAFSQNDLEVLRILSGQAGVAIQNALVHQQEQVRVAELTGLANLAQATGALSDPVDLYSRLINSISPLLDVEILGFLIYDEATRTLAGQVPFAGMPDQFVGLYRTVIPVESPADEVWLSQEAIVTENASEDARLVALGLTHLTQAAGIQNTALVPLTASGRPRGFLQAATKKDGSLIDDDDLRLLAIVAGQIGPIIENAILVQDSRRRARQSEAMRRITSLAASGATLDEILKFALLELARLLESDLAVLFLLDPDQGELRLHRPSTFGVPAGAISEIEHLPVDEPYFRQTVTGSLQPFLSDDVQTDTRLIEAYRPFFVNFPELQSVIQVPLEVRESGVGEIILGKSQAEFFSFSDAQLAATASRQLATAVERSTLYTQTDERLRLRLDRLTTLARVTRQLNAAQDLQTLLTGLQTEAVRLAGAQHASLFLLEDQESNAGHLIVRHAGVESGDHLSPLQIASIESGQPIVIDDYQNSVYSQPAQAINAGVCIPIVKQGQVVGILELGAGTRDHFDPELVELLQSLTSQAAVAIENALRLEDLQRRKAQLDQQLQSLRRLLPAMEPAYMGKSQPEVLETFCVALVETTPYHLAIFGLTVAETGMLRIAASAGIPAEVLEAAQATDPDELPWESLEDLFVPDNFIEGLYRIPARAGLESLHHLPLAEIDGGSTQWMLPLRDAGQNPLGLLVMVGQPEIDPETAAYVKMLGDQAALSIAGYSQLDRLHPGTSTYGTGSDQLPASGPGAPDRLPLLLHKDLEQTLAIQRLSQRAQKMRAGLDIAEIVNLQPDRPAVLWALGQQILTRMNLSVALVADSSNGGPRLLHSIGTISPDANPQALFGQRNPLRHALQTGEILLVSNLEEDTWKDSPLLEAMKAQAFICLPVSTNANVDAAVLAISQVALPPFSEEDRQVYHLLSSQVAITLQNLNLLTETRRRLREVGLLLEFSRQIGSLDPEQILGTLITSTRRVVKSAHAGMVAIWDEAEDSLVPRAAAGYTDNDLIKTIHYRPEEALPGQAFVSEQPLRIDEVDFAEQYKLPSESLLRYREATGGRVPVSSLLAPLKAGESTLGVLVLDNFNTPAAFSLDDQALITSLAQQTALTLENARLYQASERRAAQLRSLTGVAGTITSSLQSDELITSLLDHFATLLPYDTGTLWLRHENDLTIRAARGFEEAEQRIGLTVAVEDSQLLSEMIQSGQPINVDNVHADARFPALIEHPHLSWLGVPLISKGAVVGVIALEKTEPAFYNAEHIQVATTLAGQTTVALENARLYEESVRRSHDLNERSERLDLLNRISSELSKSIEPAQILQLTVDELNQALSASTVSAIVLDDRNHAFLHAESPPGADDLPLALGMVPLFEHLKESLGVFHATAIEHEEQLAPLQDFFAARGTRALLSIPMATGADLHGLILVQSMEEKRLPGAEVELARTVTNQAASAFQNARLFEQTRRLTEELELRVEARTAELAREHRRTQMLLEIITELSASLDLDIIINRTLSLINEITGAEQSTILLVRPEESAMLYGPAGGFTTPPITGAELQNLEVNEGLSGWVISEQEAAIIPDLVEDERWGRKEVPGSSEPRSAMAVPLLVGAESLGSLMLFHRQAAHFSPDLLDLIQATAKQIAVAINNAQLYLLIRDQAERLGSMLRSQQIETTRSRAILESVADGVLVTDASGMITLFNAAAQEILGLEQSEVIDQPLEEFTGLFGGAAQDWIETIGHWSNDPASFELGDAYAEQIELDNDRVIAVSLAPVILRDEMLGTVSVFRDITHQVEVDRLKSEFVATVSHELRTPMTSIKGYVEVLLLGAAGELNEKQTRFLEVVRSNTERLNVLVNDLLDVSRIEAGRVTLSRQPIDLKDMTEQLIAETLKRSQEEGRTITIELQSAPGLPRVVGDPERILQILSNLVDNAYNYTPIGGRITVGLHTAGEEVQVDVEDNGVGIPEEDQDRIFERFFRGEDPLVLATAGTGLGLAITRQLIEMHDGRIWFKSSGVSGKGSTFSFTLPIYQQQGQSSPSELAASHEV